MWANKIDIPFLLIHGTEDTECPIDQVYEFIAQMDRYGKTYKFIEVDGGSHDNLINEQVNPFEEILNFFENSFS